MRRLHAGSAAVTAAAALALPAAGPAAAPGPTVSVIDNAYLREVQRPVVRIRVGGSVTWRWRSRQSHNVQVASGPQRFALGFRNRGTVRRRFTRAGTYRLVCGLHAPGMRMTIVVRR